MMNNPIIISVENLTYSIVTELDTTAFSVSQIPFTIPHTIPGSRAGGVFNMTAQNLTYTAVAEQVLYTTEGLGTGVFDDTFDDTFQ